MRQPESTVSHLQLDLFPSHDLNVSVFNNLPRDFLLPPFAKPKSSTENKRTIILENHKIEYDFRRSKRRSIGFLIDEKGLRVSAPKWIAIREVEKAIREKEDWIIKKLYFFLYKYEKPEENRIELKNGFLLPYLGRKIKLCLFQADTQNIHLNENDEELIVNVNRIEDSKQLEIYLKTWFQEQALRVFLERMPCYANLLNVKYQSISLSSARQQWGSCTLEGKIRLNWRLVHFPISLIDYVIVHELAHLREMNHSRRFWNIVASVYPDYMNAKKQLRQKNLCLMPFS